LLAGVLPYFRYLSTGLSFVLMFIGAKMLSEQWVGISTRVSLAVVAGVLSAAVLASVVGSRAEARALEKVQMKEAHPRHIRNTPRADVELARLIAGLADPDPGARAQVAAGLYELGRALGEAAVQAWRADAQIARLLSGPPTVGIAVRPESFEKIRTRAGSPRLADVPPDQDAREFELHLSDAVRLDILTTNAPEGDGAIAGFLKKFGEGIQQVEFETSDVDQATELLRARFHQQPIYPRTRTGADGTRVNFFLASTPEGKKVLIEMVEASHRKKN